MFAAGGFHLRKWASNSAAVLEGVPEADLEMKISIEEGGGSSIKTLGMQWQPCSDEFLFTYHQNEILQPTKRSILSQISSLFDPLGLLAPVIVKAKLVMQRMWELKVAWDSIPPGELSKEWFDLVQSFPLLNTFQIPRRVIDMRHWSRLYLHGYCDASEVAMGACIYVRAMDDDGNTSSHLLCAKSKLAPIGNGRVTTPRLELCAAVILARLITNVQAAMATTTFYEIRAFSDSKVVLAWLSGGAARWKTFVANRVAEIVTHVPAINWYHIGTEENPADLISRGSFPEQLQQNSLWWIGPVWDPIEIENEAGTNDDLDSSVWRHIEREQRNVALACIAVHTIACCCVDIDEDNPPKKWYCQSKACQEKAQEYRQKKQDAKKPARTRKHGNELDKFSVSSCLATSSVEAKGRALEEKQKRQYEEQEVEMQ
ncbi:uncharacterized protein LOC134288548 [Aedes albopictus]|uniref:RNase H type-1 domain-containing protein n=1 Tax=Aedes albopictus TaxID=7160 RepID=A0ABM1Z2J1_AEDAL